MVEEFGFDYEYIKINFVEESKIFEYLVVNFNGCIFVINDEGFILWEFFVINFYLVKKEGGDLVFYGLFEEVLVM